MKLEPFALLDLPRTPLDRTVLVEANAGTGKTWAITGLYLRLVAERGLKPEQILAVTYTKAAMAELRQRLRSRLEEALEFLRGAGPGDEFLAGWAATLGDRGIARGHIEHALQNFDRASISTIHAFCQDLLADLAFECGVPFDVDVLADERDLMLESVDDFWREARLDSPPEARALGPVILRAARLRLMEKTGEFRQSVASNLSPKPVWRSLIREVHRG